MTTVHRRRQMRDDVERRVDEAEVGERRREVPEHALRLRVVLLGEEPDVVRKSRDAREQGEGVLSPAEQLEAVDEPERAWQEDALAGRQAVDAVAFRVVA